jgi:tetratricopeptide (TPR) repeat protein
MKKRKSDKTRVLVIIIIIGVALYSYFHSREIYTFYMRTYYEKILGQSPGQLIKKGQELYDNKEYSKLKDYLETPVIVYPDSRELKILEGLAYIKLGQGEIGSDIILSTVDGVKLPVKILEELVTSLYQLKQYKDIIMVFKTNDPAQTVILLGYYGISLVKTEKYKKAIPVLKQVVAKGGAGHEIYLNLGTAYLKIEDARTALPYLERAMAMNRTDPDTARYLAEAYRKLGRQKDWEKIMPRGR